MARHLEIFPEGQFVAMDGTGCIVGSSSSLIIDWDDYAESANWAVDYRTGYIRHPQSARQDTVRR